MRQARDRLSAEIEGMSSETGWIEAMKSMKFLIVIEKTKTGFSAYSPRLAGGVATGATRGKVEKAMSGETESGSAGMQPDKERKRSSFISRACVLKGSKSRRRRVTLRMSRFRPNKRDAADRLRRLSAKPLGR